MDWILAGLAFKERVIFSAKPCPYFGRFGAEPLVTRHMKQMIWSPQSPSNAFRLYERFEDSRWNPADDSIHPCGPPVTIEHDCFARIEARYDRRLDSIKVSCDVKRLQTRRRYTVNPDSGSVVVQFINEMAQRTRRFAGEGEQLGGSAALRERRQVSSADRGFTRGVNTFEDD